MQRARGNESGPTPAAAIPRYAQRNIRHCMAMMPGVQQSLRPPLHLIERLFSLSQKQAVLISTHCNRS